MLGLAFGLWKAGAHAWSLFASAAAGAVPASMHCCSKQLGAAPAWSACALERLRPIMLIRAGRYSSPGAPLDTSRGLCAPLSLTQACACARQLGAGGAGAALGMRRTLAAILGSRLGSKALLAGATPRVSFHEPHI